MGNKLNHIHTTTSINLFHNRQTKETKKKSHNPEKWGCDYFR